jgi:hypothetical protein
VTEHEPDGATALEQAELRKRIAESVAQQQAQRARDEISLAEQPADTLAPRATHEPRWQPPKEMTDGGDAVRLLARLVIFLLVVVGGYLIVREASYWIFGPELHVVEPIVPAAPVLADLPTVLGVRIANTSRTEGAAFVVAALGAGVEIEGRTVAVPAGETVFAPVEVVFGRGEHVVTLVVHDAWRGVRRLATLRGLSVSATAREVALHGVHAPANVTRGAAAVIDITAVNRGAAAEDVVPVVLLHDGDGLASETHGDTVAVGAGASGALRVTIDTGRLAPGLYIADIELRAADGTLLGQARHPLPLEVRQ